MTTRSDRQQTVTVTWKPTEAPTKSPAPVQAIAAASKSSRVPLAKTAPAPDKDVMLWSRIVPVGPPTAQPLAEDTTTPSVQAEKYLPPAHLSTKKSLTAHTSTHHSASKPVPQPHVSTHHASHKKPSTSVSISKPAISPLTSAMSVPPPVAPDLMHYMKALQPVPSPHTTQGHTSSKARSTPAPSRPVQLPKKRRAKQNYALLIPTIRHRTAVGWAWLVNQLPRLAESIYTIGGIAKRMAAASFDKTMNIAETMRTNDRARRQVGIASIVVIWGTIVLLLILG